MMTEARGANEAFGRVFVDELVRNGVRHAVVSPGSRSGPLALAFANESRIEMHVHLDERSAGFFALGIAKATGIPAAVLCTSGTAAANLLPAIIEARHSVTPMIVLTADRPPELRDTGANQTIDQLKMFGDAVVWFSEAGTPETSPSAPSYWRSLAGRAVGAAMGMPRGPVHLNLPFREPLYPDASTEPYPHPLDGRPQGRPWTESPGAIVVPDEPSLSRAAEMLGGAERGLVVAGATSADLRPLLELAAALGWPVLAEPASNLRVPGTIGSYDALLRAPDFVEGHQPDLVLRVGKLALGRPLAALLRSRRQIALDPDAYPLDEHRTVELRIPGDIRAVVAGLLERIVQRGPGRWARSWIEADEKARSAADGVIDAFTRPSEPRTARDLAACIPAGSNLFAASSMPVRDLECFMHPRDDIRVFANRGANGIDGSVSTTMGLAAATGAPTFALLGDLTALHDSNGFLWASNASFVVVNNDGGGIFSFLEQAGVSGFERVFGTPQGRDLEGLARFHGLDYERIESADGISIVGERGGRALFEVRTERGENVEQHRAIWDVVRSAL